MLENSKVEMIESLVKLNCPIIERLSCWYRKLVKNFDQQPQ